MASLGKVLKGFSKLWEETEPGQLGQSRVPDGDYLCSVENISVGLSKASERPQLTWELEVIEGKQKEKTILKFDGIETETGIAYAKAALELIGLKYGDLDDLPDDIEKFFKKKKDDIIVNVTVKTDGEFKNIYINGLEEGERKGRGEEEEEEESSKKKKKGGKKEKKFDPEELDDMDKSELMDVADYHGLKVPKDIRDSSKKIRNWIKEQMAD